MTDSKLDLNITQKKLDDIDNYDDQILKLKSEVRVLTREKTDLLIRWIFSVYTTVFLRSHATRSDSIFRIDDLEPLYPLRRSYLPLYRDVSPVRVRSPVRYRSPSPTRANITNDIRANRLITRNVFGAKFVVWYDRIYSDILCQGLTLYQILRLRFYIKSKYFTLF